MYIFVTSKKGAIRYEKISNFLSYKKALNKFDIYEIADTKKTAINLLIYQKGSA